jgi:hypothetical protein
MGHTRRGHLDGPSRVWLLWASHCSSSKRLVSISYLGAAADINPSITATFKIESLEKGAHGVVVLGVVLLKVSAGIIMSVDN